MSNFIDINLNISTSAKTKEVPVVSTTNRKVISAFVSNKKKETPSNLDAASKASVDQETIEMERAWLAYQEIKPRIINVLRMLADS